MIFHLFEDCVDQSGKVIYKAGTLIRLGKKSSELACRTGYVYLTGSHIKTRIKPRVYDGKDYTDYEFDYYDTEEYG